MSESDADASRQWVVPPPERGEVALRLALGDGVELTADQEAALSALLHVLEANDAEVTGFEVGCPSYSGCSAKKITTCSAMRCVQLQCGPYQPQTGRGIESWNLVGAFRLGASQ